MPRVETSTGIRHPLSATARGDNTIEISVGCNSALFNRQQLLNALTRYSNERHLSSMSETSLPDGRRSCPATITRCGSRLILTNIHNNNSAITTRTNLRNIVDAAIAARAAAAAAAAPQIPDTYRLSLTGTTRGYPDWPHRPELAVICGDIQAWTPETLATLQREQRSNPGRMLLKDGPRITHFIEDINSVTITRS